MTNELRIKIAESLGWKMDYPALDDYDREILSWRNPMGRGPLNEAYIPNYDTDANAALQLVEALEKDGWFPQIKLALNHSKNKWGCAFSAYGKPQHFATAPTLPEAICLAYCAVKSIQTDK